MTQTVPDSARQMRQQAGISGAASQTAPPPESAWTGFRGAEYVAPMCAYLASDEAWNINGQVFHVAGGRVGLGTHPVPMRTIQSDHLWTLSELDDAVQNVLMREIDNPAPPREDVEVPGRDTEAQALT